MPSSHPPPPDPESAPAPAWQWHERYTPVDDPGARRLLERALAFSERTLGAPATPVRGTRLRLSRPLDPSASIASGFQLTEINRLDEGLFTIYVSVPPGAFAFHGQLAHEAFHLFEPRFRDVYVEGLNTWLAERFLRSEGLDWRPWREHFARGGDPLYGASYALIEEIEAIVGADALHVLPRHGRRRSGQPAGRSVLLEVDIDAWIRTLPASLRVPVCHIIQRRYDAIESIRRRSHPEYAFMRPGNACR